MESTAIASPPNYAMHTSQFPPLPPPLPPTPPRYKNHSYKWNESPKTHNLFPYVRSHSLSSRVMESAHHRSYMSPHLTQHYNYQNWYHYASNHYSRPKQILYTTSSLSGIAFSRGLNPLMDKENQVPLHQNLQVQYQSTSELPPNATDSALITSSQFSTLRLERGKQRGCERHKHPRRPNIAIDCYQVMWKVNPMELATMVWKSKKLLEDENTTISAPPTLKKFYPLYGCIVPSINVPKSSSYWKGSNLLSDINVTDISPVLKDYEISACPSFAPLVPSNIIGAKGNASGNYIDPTEKLPADFLPTPRKTAAHMAWWPGDWKCNQCGTIFPTFLKLGFTIVNLRYNLSLFGELCKRCKLGLCQDAGYIFQSTESSPT